MLTFRTLVEAANIAGFEPIFQIDTGVDRLFIVLYGSVEAMKGTEVALLTPEEDSDRWRHAGHIKFKHLDRFGDANWAATAPATAFNAFPQGAV
jgi:hypothetical protein